MANLCGTPGKTLRYKMNEIRKALPGASHRKKNFIGMVFMRIALIILLVLFTPFLVAQKNISGRQELVCENFIAIQGETNLNEFHLQQFVPDDEVCAPGESGWIYFPASSYYQIKIPVRNFSANNQLIYKDFLSLIKASEFPYIQIFIDAKQFHEFYSSKSVYFPNILISIAGVTESFLIKCYVIECKYGNRIIHGEKTLKLTDFKLDPPVKSFGLIKVKNELNINFEFKMPDNLVTKASEK